MPASTPSMMVAAGTHPASPHWVRCSGAPCVRSDEIWIGTDLAFEIRQLPTAGEPVAQAIDLREQPFALGLIGSWRQVGFPCQPISFNSGFTPSSIAQFGILQVLRLFSGNGFACVMRRFFWHFPLWRPDFPCRCRFIRRRLHDRCGCRPRSVAHD